MAFQQLIKANPNVPYRGGWCLAAVQDAFGTDHPYPTAIAQWQNGGYQHSGTPPLGIDVPIFFSMRGVPAGHVAVRLANGNVASSSQSGQHPTLYIHKNIADLMSFYSSVHDLTYLGWSEVVGTKKVVKEITVPNEKDVKDYFRVWENKVPTTAQIKYYTTKTWRTLTDNILDSQRKKRNASEATLKAEIASKQAIIDKLTAEAKTAGVGQDVLDKINNTDANVSWIKALLERIFK